MSGDITIILASHISNTDGKTSNYLEEKRNRQKCIHFTHVRPMLNLPQYLWSTYPTTGVSWAILHTKK